MVLSVRTESGPADFQRPQTLLKGLLEGPADGHGFAHRFHGSGEDIRGFGKFFKCPPGNFDHAVINGRFKTGHGFAGDIIGYFIQGISHRQFGRDLGNGKTGGFGSQGRTSRHPGVHFHHNDIPVFRIHGKLHIGAPRVHTDLPDDGNGRITQYLIFFVREGLDRRHGDGISSVNPHGIHILDGADDNHIIGMVPHHLQFIFLPSQHRFLQLDLADKRCIQTGLGHAVQLFHVVGHPAAGAAQREAGPDNQRESDLFCDCLHLRKIVGKPALGNAQADLVHGVAEKLSVFGLVDGFNGGADQFHVVLFKYPCFGGFDGGVQSGLASQSGQHSIRPFRSDHLAQGVRCDRFDIDPVRGFRIGHDGGRIGVDEDHLESLFLQGFAGLGAGIVEFAGLADNNGTGPDDQDFFDIITLWHGSSLWQTG